MLYRYWFIAKTEIDIIYFISYIQPLNDSALQHILAKRSGASIIELFAALLTFLFYLSIDVSTSSPRPR